MQNFHIKSVILGIGIGIIITSIISIIYLAGANTSGTMSKEAIMQKAREYGMVDGTALLKDSTKKTEERADSQKLASDPGASFANTDQNSSKATEKTVQNEENKQQSTLQQVQTTGQEITVRINPGDTSETVADRLFKDGMISNKSAFIKTLTDMGLTTEIEIGEFKIIKGMEDKEIIKVLTKK